MTSTEHDPQAIPAGYDPEQFAIWQESVDGFGGETPVAFRYWRTFAQTDSYWKKVMVSADEGCCPRCGRDEVEISDRERDLFVCEADGCGLEFFGEECWMPSGWSREP